jgi:hypothetical protein
MIELAGEQSSPATEVADHASLNRCSQLPERRFACSMAVPGFDQPRPSRDRLRGGT